MTGITAARRGSRSGAIGLAGAAVNGAFGFVLTTVLTRTYGVEDAGTLFTVIGLVSILGAVCCLGADTGLMWALPRKPSFGVRRLMSVALVPSVGVSLLVAALGLAVAGPLARALAVPDPDLLRLAFAGVPVIVAATVLLAGVRATRPVTAYVGVQFVLVPVLRPILLIAAGGSLLLGFGAWLLPVAVSLLIAAALAPRPAGPAAFKKPARSPAASKERAPSPAASTEPAEPAVSEWRAFWAYALPRAASVAVDASSMWVGVLLTGALDGPQDAGLFAAAGRYAMAGLLIMQGLRVAVAPQLSRLLGDGNTAEAAAIYRRTTLAIVALSWPAYLLLAIFAPAFLALFGDGFADAAVPLAVLAAAMLVNVGVGLVQTVLLMSGNSRGHLTATLCGLAINVVAAVLLIPGMGALGAALAWSAGIVTENVLAAVLARRALGESLFSRRLLGVTGAVIMVTGVAASAGLWLGGRNLPGLAVALAILVVAGGVSTRGAWWRSRI